MASIYDSYQIAQSQLARPYIGNSLSEIRELGNEMQRRYDTTTANMDQMDLIRRQVQTDPKSRQALESTLSGISNQLRDYASRPDKENLVRPTTILARDFAADAQVFMGNMKAIQDYQDEIDKRTDVDRDTKERTKRLALAEYQGIQRDPSGRLTNRFTGSYTPPKSIDALAFVNKVGDGIKADAGGREVRQIDGNYYVEQGNKWEKVSKDRVDRITQNLIASDPEMQAYLNYQQTLGTKEDYYTNKVTDLNSIQDEKLRARVGEIVAKTGLKPREAYAQLAGASNVSRITSSLRQAAIDKFAYQESSTTNKVMGETEQHTRDKTDAALSRIAVAAPAMAIVNEAAGKGLNDLTTAAAEKEDQTKVLEGRLSQLIATDATPFEIAQAQGQLAALKGQKLQMEGIRARSLDQAAREMNFKGGYKDYYDKQAKNWINRLVDAHFQDFGPTTGISFRKEDGTTTGISKAVLTNLIHQGKVKPIMTAVNSPSGIGYVPGQKQLQGISGYEIEGPNGQKYTLDKNVGSGANFNRLLEIMREAPNDIVGEQINKRADEMLKEGRFQASSGTAWSLDGEKGKTGELLGEIYKSSPTSFNVYDLKDGKRIDDMDDLPPELKFASIEAVKDSNGEPILYGSYTSGKKGEETTKRYRIIPVAGSNISRHVGASMFMEAAKIKDPNNAVDLYNAATSLIGGEWAEVVRNMAVNERIPIIDKFSERIGWLQYQPGREGNQAGGYYQFYNEDGTPIADQASYGIHDTARKLEQFVDYSSREKAKQRTAKP